MKIYTREEVMEKIKEFQELLGKEKALQEEILGLKIHGDKETVKKNQQRHDEIMAEIEEIRFKKMLPILTEMSTFVKECQVIENEQKKKASPAETEDSQK